MGGSLARGLSSISKLPLGRRFDPRRDRFGLLQRWYAAQPAQRIVVAVLQPSASVTRETLERSLRELCARYPEALGVCQERSHTQLHVRPLTAADALPVETHVRASDAPALDSLGDSEAWEIASALVHRPFTLGAPLFRVVLSSDRRYVVSAFDHLIADGVSVAIFGAELASLLQGRPLLPTAGDAALPLDARLDIRPSLGTLARALGSSLTGVLLTPKTAVFRPQPLRTRILPLGLPSAAVVVLRGRARQYGVSLHAVLASAALHAALESLEVSPARVRLNTPISLRDQCQPSPKGLGVFIAGIDTDLSLSREEDVWSVARRCMADLARKRPTAHRSVGLLALAGDLHARAAKLERAANGRTATVEVSNVGRVAGVPPGTALWLTQGAHYHAALFVLTVATSEGDGDMRCCLSYPDPLVERPLAKRFMRAFERCLQEMAGPSESAN